jgi:tight adherence protein B
MKPTKKCCARPPGWGKTFHRKNTLNQSFLLILLIAIYGFALFGLIAVTIILLRMNTQNRFANRVTRLVETQTEEQQFARTTSSGEISPEKRFEGLRGQINRALSFFSTDKLRLKIASAYWPISDIEFIIIQILVALLGFIIGWIIPGSIIGGLALGLLMYLIPGFILDRAIIQRRKMFQEQLLDFLVLIKGAIIAGYSLAQAMDMAIKEIPAPTSEEFSQVLREVKFGFPLEQALQNLSNRMQSDDLHIVVTAILLNTQMGGNLSTVLEATIDTIRERIHLYGEIRSLTSYARYVGALITFLPFLTGLIIFFINPGFFDNVKTSPISQMILLLALVGVILGNFLIRRIMNIKV